MSASLALLVFKAFGAELTSAAVETPQSALEILAAAMIWIKERPDAEASQTATGATKTGASARPPVVKGAAGKSCGRHNCASRRGR
jgi:hypothetical protein